MHEIFAAGLHESINQKMDSYYQELKTVIVYDKY
jgi:hypothetical protein